MCNFLYFKTSLLLSVVSVYFVNPGFHGLSLDTIKGSFFYGRRNSLISSLSPHPPEVFIVRRTPVSGFSHETRPPGVLPAHSTSPSTHAHVWPCLKKRKVVQ